jgi:hypothetical protein
MMISLYRSDACILNASALIQVTNLSFGTAEQAGQPNQVTHTK